MGENKHKYMHARILWVTKNLENLNFLAKPYGR